MREIVYFSSSISRIDGSGGISTGWDCNYPFESILFWYRERYSHLKSFEFEIDWKKSIFHFQPIFKMTFDPEEIIIYLQWNRDKYLEKRATNWAQNIFNDILFYADPDRIFHLTFQKQLYHVFSYVLGFEGEDLTDHFLQHIDEYPVLYMISERIRIDSEKKKILFEELMEKTWHPDRVMKWCLCE